MLILSIETSCDETSLALLDFDNLQAHKLLAQEISSQSHIHELYGGVVPELASREHLRALPLLLDKVLSDAKIEFDQVKVIAVTQGPGLKGCLLTGVTFAKGLSLAKNIPLIGVNHIEGHLLAPMMDNPELKFPYLCLVVSGGHTEILLVKNLAEYSLLTRTIDDAAGEAFDKSANLLGFAYPGGAKLAALADTVTFSPFNLPKVMREAEGFSFSGLKTAISMLLEKNKTMLEQDKNIKAQLAFTIQSSIVDALCFKLKEAIQKTGIYSIALSGGVSANRALREKAKAISGTKLYLPKPIHCTDNAAMIAYVGAARFSHNEKSSLDLDVKSRWPVEG